MEREREKMVCAARALSIPILTFFFFLSLSLPFFPKDRFESLAYFSSTGPTPDGRTKPDLVAPGTTVSSFSDGDPASGNCGWGVDRGTSMATPVGAGAALLARQYFMEGWHVTGAPNASAGMVSPSSALLRAVLLGGAAPMRGVRPSNGGAVDGAPLEVGPSEGGPSAAVGHGRLHLGRALPLAPLNASAWGLAVVDGALLRSQGAAARFCVRAAPGHRPLSITLAWTDPPPSPAAASPLVNDLDLTVTTEALAGYPRRGNGGPAPDRANTVERVWLDDGGGAGGGEVVISVAAARLPAPPQAFALAVHVSRLLCVCVCVCAGREGERKRKSSTRALSHLPLSFPLSLSPFLSFPLSFPGRPRIGPPHRPGLYCLTHPHHHVRPGRPDQRHHRPPSLDDDGRAAGRVGVPAGGAGRGDGPAPPPPFLPVRLPARPGRPG